MDLSRQYQFEGVTLDIPLRYDKDADMFLEIYPDFTADPVWTPQGQPVMFAGEDACVHAQEAAPGGCPDCGSCRFYRKASEHTWIGVCGNEARRKPEVFQLNE